MSEQRDNPLLDKGLMGSSTPDPGLNHPTAQDNLDSVKKTVVGDFEQDRRTASGVLNKQIRFVEGLMLGMVLLSGAGVCVFLMAVASGIEVDDWQQVTQSVSGVTASLFGFTIPKLFARWRQLGEQLVTVEKEFTSDINLVRMSKCEDDVRNRLVEYCSKPVPTSAPASVEEGRMQGSGN